MKKTLLITITLVGALCTPAWAINKCTGPDGKVVFQDKDCPGQGEKLNVRPAAGAAPSALAVQPGAAPPMTEAQRINKIVDESQRDRRRRDLQTRLLPDARNYLEQHRYQCKETQNALQSQQYRYQQNLYGKTHAAQIASEMAAAAAVCDTRDRELKEQVDTLEKECASLGCK